MELVNGLWRRSDRFNVYASAPPPYSTMTFVLAVILGGILIVAMYLILSLAIPAFFYANNLFTNVTSNISGVPVASVSSGNVSVQYLNSSYDKSQSVIATVSLYLGSVLLSPLGLSVLAGISLVIYALFEVRRKNNG